MAFRSISGRFRARATDFRTRKKLAASLRMWDLTTAFVVALVVVIVLFVILRAYGVRGFSALVVSLLIGLLVLLATANPRDMTLQQLASSQAQFYAFIVGIIVIILIIYILVMALRDKEPRRVDISYVGKWAPVPLANSYAGGPVMVQT